MDDKNLPSPMCWDAVKKCDAKVVAVHRNVNAQHGLVSFADEFVRTREDVKKLMPGYGRESHNPGELRWEKGASGCLLAARMEAPEPCRSAHDSWGPIHRVDESNPVTGPSAFASIDIAGKTRPQIFITMA